MSREVKLLEKEIEKLERFDPADESKARYEGIVKGLNEALNLVKSVEIELNENQQIVLEWLKEVYIDNDEGFFSVISYLTNPTTEEEVNDPAHIALACLYPDEEVQVLAAFAEWGMKNE